MGFWEFLTGATPGGAAASTAKVVVTSVFDGLDRLIRDFKIPPEELVKYEQFKLENITKLEAIDASDRSSARQREMVLRDHTPAVLAGLFVLIFGVAQWFVFTHTLPTGNEMLIARVLGTLDMSVGMILGYYFGSSSSSRGKDEVIGQIAAASSTTASNAVAASQGDKKP